MLAQALEAVNLERSFVSADDAITPNPEWLQTEWQQARNMTRNGLQPVIFVVDEVGLRRKSWTVPYAASPRLRRYCAGLM